LLLNMLDGAEELDNVVLITTNYPGKPEARVINRPSWGSVRSGRRPAWPALSDLAE
jgi:hypothetical protein